MPLILVNPAENPDYAVCFRHEWVPYILGSLNQLMLQTTWNTDDPIQIVEMQQRAALLIALFAESCPMPVPDGVEFEGSELDMTLCESLRFQDGKLQAFCCGVWTDIPGQPANGIGGTGQPGEGAPQAPAGGCVTYNARFRASSPWLLPTVVNTGDTLTFTQAKGASQDGTLTDTWHCPDGGVFYAGACVGAAHFEGTDPAPLIEHMRFVVLINGVYYPADQGVLTVPSGVANAQAAIQVNDSQLYDNAGDLMLTIGFCNNQGTTFDHLFNFLLTPGGFTAGSFGGGTPTWTPAVGWESSHFTDGGCSGGSDASLIDLTRAMPSPRYITTIRVKGTTSSDKGSGNGARQLVIDGGSPINLGLDTTSTAFDVSIPINATVNATIHLDFNSICFPAFPHTEIELIEVIGNGTDPF